MSYPFSINKKVIINSDKVNLDSLIREFTSLLDSQRGTLTELKGRRIKILTTDEFSMNTSSLVNFNYGEITLEEDQGNIKIQGKIFVIEHAIFFGLTVIIFAYLGLFHFTKLEINLGIPFLLLLVEFVFAYLFPMMRFKSIIDESVTKGIENHSKQDVLQNI